MRRGKKEEINSPHEGFQYHVLSDSVDNTNKQNEEKQKMEGWCTGTFRLRVVNKVAAASRGRSEFSSRKERKKVVKSGQTLRNGMEEMNYCQQFCVASRMKKRSKKRMKKKKKSGSTRDNLWAFFTQTVSLHSIPPIKYSSSRAALHHFS